ncbi:hypothetical protein GPJ56_004965 [Histomonas meleagridis]|uniref:uncharacterized protein n=1 Tax=Histomonas meleagridis TaxID=135588 RepID=UPI00355995D5|nr:hypothetical protein GPJ56_004965 [Histomonas meleagridis]KAH0798509.1 hypothetical protein GO595_008374 [Histomonas meleagridis]
MILLFITTIFSKEIKHKFIYYGNKSKHDDEKFKLREIYNNKCNNNPQDKKCETLRTISEQYEKYFIYRELSEIKNIKNEVTGIDTAIIYIGADNQKTPIDLSGISGTKIVIKALEAVDKVYVDGKMNYDSIPVLVFDVPIVINGNMKAKILFVKSYEGGKISSETIIAPLSLTKTITAEKIFAYYDSINEIKITKENIQIDNEISLSSIFINPYIDSPKEIIVDMTNEIENSNMDIYFENPSFSLYNNYLDGFDVDGYINLEKYLNNEVINSTKIVLKDDKNQASKLKLFIYTTPKSRKLFDEKSLAGFNNFVVKEDRTFEVYKDKEQIVGPLQQEPKEQSSTDGKITQQNPNAPTDPSKISLHSPAQSIDPIQQKVTGAPKLDQKQISKENKTRSTNSTASANKNEKGSNVGLIVGIVIVCIIIIAGVATAIILHKKNNS